MSLSPIENVVLHQGFTKLSWKKFVAPVLGASVIGTGIANKDSLLSLFGKDKPPSGVTTDTIWASADKKQFPTLAKADTFLDNLDTKLDNFDKWIDDPNKKLMSTDNLGLKLLGGGLALGGLGYAGKKIHDEYKSRST